jgi:hypothetical protein
MVGSVSGTLAWYQFSNRVTAAFIGTNVGTSENLQVKKSDGTYVTDLKSADVSALMGGTGSQIQPVTAGSLAKDGSLSGLYEKPLYQESLDYTEWTTADTAHYVQFQLDLRALSKDGSTETREARDVYLSDVTIQGDSSTPSGKKDLSSAVRVQISSSSANLLFAKGVTTIDTHGALDLNGDGENDKDNAYEFETGNEISYGGKDAVETSYDSTVKASSEHQDSPIATLGSKQILGGTKLGTTGESDLSLTVTIWIEGWAKLPGADSTASSMWDPALYSGALFDVGLQFACVTSETPHVDA